MMSVKKAIEKAEYELSMARHNGETMKNPGLRAICNNKAEWLSIVVYLAKQAIKEVTVPYIADTAIQEHKTGMFYYGKEDFDNLVKELMGKNDKG